MKNLLYFAFGVFLIGCTANSQDKKEELEVQVLPVTRLVTADTTLQHDYVGDIQAVQNVEIRAQVQGYLQKIYVDEGQEVKKGQPLFRINDEGYQAQLAQAKADLKSALAEAKAAELQVDRVKVVVDHEVFSKSELEMAQAQLEAAKARVDKARSALTDAQFKLSHTYIKAPFDGIINRIPHKVGSLVDEGTLLTTVSDYASVFAYFSVSENEYLEYMKSRQEGTETNNDEVDLLLANGTVYPYSGKIETMASEFDAGTGSIPFRARFPNPDKLLKHGSTGSIRLTFEERNALILPQKAAFEIQDQNFVYLVDAQNQLVMRSFVPKARFSHFYIVESGLKPGDKVVYEGVQTAREGMKIMPEYVQMDGVAAPAAAASAQQVKQAAN
jgi:membrane fusion protein, multidrug efflux system